MLQFTLLATLFIAVGSGSTCSIINMVAQASVRRNILTISIISQMTLEDCEGTVFKIASLLAVQLFLNELQSHVD